MPPALSGDSAPPLVFAVTWQLGGDHPPLFDLVQCRRTRKTNVLPSLRGDTVLCYSLSASGLMAMVCCSLVWPKVIEMEDCRRLCH